MSATRAISSGYGECRPMMDQVESVGLPKPKNQTASVSVCGRFWAIPHAFFSDRQWMLFLCLFLGVTTQAFTLVGGAPASYVPYVGLATSPLYLSHAIRSASSNFKLLGEAAKTRQVAKTVFYLLMAVSSFSSAFSNIIKPCDCGVELSGFSNYGACALVFGRILPILMMTLGSISAVAGIAELWRAQAELKALQKKTENAELKQLESIFQEIKQVQKDLLSEDRRKEVFESENAKRQKEIQDRFGKHSFSYSCPLQDFVKPRFRNPKDENNDSAELLIKAQELFKAILQDEVHVKDLKALMQSIENEMVKYEVIFQGEEIANFKKALDEQKKEIEHLERSLSDVNTEMRRKIMGHAIMLFLAILTVVGGIISMQQIPHHELVGSILIITGCLSGMGQILFDKTVTHEQYLKMDRWLHGLLHKSA